VRLQSGTRPVLTGYCVSRLSVDSCRSAGHNDRVSRRGQRLQGWIRPEEPPPFRRCRRDAPRSAAWSRGIEKATDSCASARVKYGTAPASIQGRPLDGRSSLCRRCHAGSGRNAATGASASARSAPIGCGCNRDLAGHEPMLGSRLASAASTRFARKHQL
jgi:hypothetical protein